MWGCEPSAAPQQVEDHPDCPQVLKQLAEWSKLLQTAAPKVGVKQAQLGFAAA
jgi:hypothetical protein